MPCRRITLARAASCGVARHEHAAFAGGDGLVGVEAEDRGLAAQRAHERAAAGGGQRVRGVLDHLQAVAPRESSSAGMSACQAGVVHAA
jgi:hypothetical protein